MNLIDKLKRKQGCPKGIKTKKSKKSPLLPRNQDARDSITCFPKEHRDTPRLNYVGINPR